MATYQLVVELAYDDDRFGDQVEVFERVFHKTLDALATMEDEIQVLTYGLTRKEA